MITAATMTPIDVSGAVTVRNEQQQMSGQRRLLLLAQGIGKREVRRRKQQQEESRGSVQSRRMNCHRHS
jgi:hypothetical protein